MTDKEDTTKELKCIPYNVQRTVLQREDVVNLGEYEKIKNSRKKLFLIMVNFLESKL